MPGRNLEAEVTALKVVVLSILAELGTRDERLLRDILANVDVLDTAGAMPLYPALGEIKVALDKLLNEVRSSLASE